jgi:hypothetical protein
MSILINSNFGERSMGNWGGVRDILIEMVGLDEESNKNDAEIKLLAQQRANLVHVENKYLLGTFYGFLQILIGWILLISGIAVAITSPFANLINITVAAIMVPFGLMQIFIGQLMQSSFDTANNTREILLFLRRSQEENSQNQSQQE